MARKVIGNAVGSHATSQKAASASPAARHLSPSAALRSRRSRAYVECVSGLDGLAPTDTGAAKRMAEAIGAEFASLELPEVPLGLLAKCHLGQPHDVHMLDLTGQIVRHVKRQESLPGPYAGARTLALHPAYAFIEVYPSSLHCVRADGTVTTVEAKKDK